MSKKILVLLLSLSLLLSLVACGQGKAPETTGTGETTKATEASDPTTEPVQEDTTAATETTAPAETENQTAEEQYLEKYAPVLDRYSQALQEQWNEGMLFQEGMCTLSTYCYEGNPLENVGYTLMDLDGDGIWELIIGAIRNAEQDPLVFEIWALKNDEPVMLVQSGSHNRYYLQYAEEDNLWSVAYEAENGAANHAVYYLQLFEGEFSVTQGIIFDAAADEENPWFMTYDLDWDVSNDTPIDEDTANAVMNAGRNTYAPQEYFPYSLYK